MKKKSPANRLPDILDRAPLHYAPKNELGVVFLFSHMLKKLRLTIHEIRPQYPDCIAYQKVGGGQKEVRIEFEYKSRNFKSQRHNPKGCDWIVCWEHNWPDIPKHLTVVELRREFGLGFNTWIVPVGVVNGIDYGEILSESDYDESWSVPSLAHIDDLLLYYHSKRKTKNRGFIIDIFRLAGDVTVVKKPGWRKRPDYIGPIQRVCQLKSPIYLEDMKRNKVLESAPFIRGSMQGRPKVTEYWPYLFDMIIRRNPSVKKILTKYAPEKL